MCLGVENLELASGSDSRERIQRWRCCVVVCMDLDFKVQVGSDLAEVVTLCS
jgi:hypothetical protein